MRYRSENISGSGVKDILAVMIYEINELGNTDILRTLLPTIKQANGTLATNMQNIIDNLEGTSPLDNIIEEDISNTCKQIIECLNSIYHRDIKYCLWLADYKTVMQYYGQGKLDPSSIDSYEESDIILSNVEPDGSLYAYEELPVKHI